MLADTSFLIDILRGKKEAVDFLKKIETQQLFTTEINVFELIVGTNLKKQGNPEKDLERIYGLLSRFIVLPLERRGALEAGKITADLIKKGQQIEETDALIAGISLSNGISQIITVNEYHYERISGVRVLSY